MVMAVALATPILWSSTAAADGQPVPGFRANGVVIDASFSAGKNVVPQEVVELRDGSLVVGGLLQETGQAAAQQFIARYSPSGALDPSFGNGGLVFPTRT